MSQCVLGANDFTLLNNKIIVARIDQLPAGGDGLGVIVGAAVLIFPVLLITDVLGVTDIFPFVKKVDK